MSADGTGVVSHAGSRLLADLAERSSLTGQLSEALGPLRRPRAVHDPGRVLTDLAVSIADGGECISDIAVLGDQSALFGPVASDSTVWQLLDALDTRQLAAIARARAAAREVVWAQWAEATGAAFGPARAAGRELPGLVIDLDATTVVCHSEEQAAAPTFKHLRVSPDAGLPGQHRRSVGRPAAAGQRRRPRGGPGPHPDPDPRRAPARRSARRRSWPTSAACVSSTSRPSSASAGPSPTGNAPPSPPCPSTSGQVRSTPDPRQRAPGRDHRPAARRPRPTPSTSRLHPSARHPPSRDSATGGRPACQRPRAEGQPHATP